MKTDALPFGLTFIQTLEAIGAIFGCLMLFLIVVAFVLDKLNVKTFSFKNGFTFYEEGSSKRSRLTGRHRTVTKRKVR